ncbi:hypothetical protein I6D99_17060, partial [Staphylococcus aureus]|nr:hypothetical protein [Staphylococcus aureus]
IVKSTIEAAREMTQEQLRDYVKTSDYKTDKNGIVERLNTAEAERKTLKGEIKDKVTLNEYQNGLAESKKYSEEQDKIRELEIKAYADGIVSQEEQRAIDDAKQKLQEAKEIASQEADNAFDKSKKYTDGISQNTDRKLRQMETSIEHNGQEISSRVTLKEFNASNKTLSNIITEIVQNITE